MVKFDDRGTADLERIIEEQKLEIENLQAEVKYERLLRTRGYYNNVPMTEEEEYRNAGISKEEANKRWFYYVICHLWTANKYDRIKMLTRRQLQLYNFLKVYFKKNKIMPSFDEILLFMKMKSKAQAFQMLGYLEYKGYIKRNPHKARSIEITKEI